MRKVIPFIIMLFSLPLLVRSQVTGEENCNSSSELYKDHIAFTPDEGSPIFTIKLNYIIPQRADGSANFDKKNPEHMALFEKSIAKINALWSNLKRPKDTDCYPHDDFIADTGIRFVLNEIIVVQNDMYNDSDQGKNCPNRRSWFLNPLDEEIRQDPRYADAVNVYVTTPASEYQRVVLNGDTTGSTSAGPPCSEFPSYKNLHESSRIHLSGRYTKYHWMRHHLEVKSNYPGKTWESSFRSWMFSSFGHTMAHELGHTMGLHHQNEYHGRNKCDESILNQRHGKPHNYLQPTEIAKMHRNVRMTNLRQFLEQDVYVQKPWLVADSMGISMSYWAFEDIIVEEDAVLHISCELSLHPRSRIIVRPGGRVIITDDGSIAHRGARSTGIILERERGWFLFKKRARKEGILQGKRSAYAGEVEKRKKKLPQ